MAEDLSDLTYFKFDFNGPFMLNIEADRIGGWITVDMWPGLDCNYRHTYKWTFVLDDVLWQSFADVISGSMIFELKPGHLSGGLIDDHPSWALRIRIGIEEREWYSDSVCPLGLLETYQALEILCESLYYRIDTGLTDVCGISVAHEFSSDYVLSTVCSAGIRYNSRYFSPLLKDQDKLREFLKNHPLSVKDLLCSQDFLHKESFGITVEIIDFGHYSLIWNDAIPPEIERFISDFQALAESLCKDPDRKDLEAKYFFNPPAPASDIGLSRRTKEIIWAWAEKSATQLPLETRDELHKLILAFEDAEKTLARLHAIGKAYDADLLNSVRVAINEVRQFAYCKFPIKEFNRCILQ